MENAMQTLLPGFFILITVVILGMLVYLTLKGMQEKKANDAAPIVTVDAKVKAKRIAVHHSAHQQSMNGVPLMAKSHHTTYYATFALEVGVADQRGAVPAADRGGTGEADLSAEAVPPV